jgi:diguanylate cyclase (GGDEF)-like protein
MTNSPPQPSTFQATLVLEDGAQLSGELTLTSIGDMVLASVRLKAAPEGGGRVSVKAGMPATMSLDGRGDSATTAVVVERISGNNLALQHSEPDSQAAQSFMQFLQGGPATPELQQGKQIPLTGSTLDNSRILEEFRRRAMAELESIVSGFLKELSAYLLDISARIKPPEDGRNPFFDAASALRRDRKQICVEFLNSMDDYFAQLVPADGEDVYWQQEVKNGEDLGLVDLEEFEGHLAIDRMVALGEDLHRIPLEALLIRVSELIEEDPLNVRLPLHARQLSRSFQQCLTVGAAELAPETLTVSYDFFARKVIRHLRDFYGRMNAFLSDHNIGTGLEEQIRQKGTLLKTKSKVHHPKRPEHKQPDPSEFLQPPDFEYGSDSKRMAQDNRVAPKADETAKAAATDSPLHPGPPPPLMAHPGERNIYKSVVDALNFRREIEGLASGIDISSGVPLSGTWDGSTVPSTEIDQQALADANTIAQALGAIQRDSQVQEGLREASSLREYLAENREQLGALKNTSGLTAESLNQLDLVDNLFGTIKSQFNVSSEMKPTLSNLQIPLAKLALLDPMFFSDKEHSAREVIDKLSGLATSANFPNKALEQRINDVVDEIVTDYERDSSVFERAREKIDKLAAQQERALSRNIERVVRIQEGQEKLQKARRAVAEIINERIRPPAAPKILLDLVESGWRDLLVLTHVKEGPESPALSEHIKTLDLLSSWLDKQQQGDLNDDLLMQRSLEAETLIDMIGQQISAALPTNIAHQDVLGEMRDILASNLAVESAEVSDEGRAEADDPEKFRAKVDDLPRLRRWVRRVEQLEADSWLSFRDNEGQKRRMQLAWISEARDRYIFVNERGQKIADLNAVQLARKLSRGAQPPAPADKLSVVDQSMYHTLEHVQKTLSFSRNHDTLTKLINRETFVDQMTRTLRHAQLKNSQHAVLHLDIDKFSLVNDVYDRVSGDQVLTEFSALLSQLHGKKSSSARFESDQFGVLLLDRNLEQAAQFADKIRTDIEASSLEIDGEKVSFTVSIGVAPILEYSPSVEDILAAAKAACRRAKDLGRNRVQIYEEDLALAGQFEQEKSRTKENLEQALATDRFLLRAQPIVQTAIDGESESSRHYELLLALTNKDGSLSSPGKFIDSAERYGFMTLVDRWVVKEAFSWISELMDAQKEVPSLAINLSGSSVTDDDFMEYVLEQISEFGVGTSKICFEITETSTISNLVKAADFVRAFRNIGCKFSIDDFGTGLASHNYLRELPVDYVKIDGTFVTSIHENRADYAMARSINDLAHFLGQETIAESVENDQIIARLREIGVDYLQGWGIARPKPLTDIAEELSSIAR